MMALRALVATCLLLPVLSAQQEASREARSPHLGPGVPAVARPAPTAALTDTVAAQQRSWRRLLAGLSLDGPAEATPPSVRTTPAADVVRFAPSATAGAVDTVASSATPAPVTPAADSPAPADVALRGMVTLRLPTVEAGDPLVVARTPRREVQPGRSGTLRLSTAPTGLTPLGTGTVRRLMSGSTPLPLPMLVTASTRRAAPALAAPAERAPAVPGIAPGTPALRADGLASSLERHPILCAEAPARSLPGTTAAAEPRCDQLVDGLFRPADAPTAHLPSLVDLGLGDEHTVEIEPKDALDWLWDEQTLIRFESVIDEDNPFQGTGRTWLFTVFTGL